jgi:hypothetical protein
MMFTYLGTEKFRLARLWMIRINVGSPMILVPNDKTKLHPWDRYRHFADYMFINQWSWKRKHIQWRSEVIVMVGHDDERYERAVREGRMEREPIWT